MAILDCTRGACLAIVVLSIASAPALAQTSGPKPGPSASPAVSVPISPGERIVAAARQMAGPRPEYVIGDCWDFANAVFWRAGFPQEARQTVFNGKKTGPYADRSLVQPGDWIYLTISGDSWEHSVIFIEWLEPAPGRLARVADYKGSSRPEPPYVNEREIADIWTIIRATDKNSLVPIPVR